MIHLFLLALEFCAVFFGLPLLLFYRILPNYPIPYLLLAAIASGTIHPLLPLNCLRLPVSGNSFEWSCFVMSCFSLFWD
jgi:hypothetical protein